MQAFGLSKTNLLKEGLTLAKKEITGNPQSVDKGLVAMFLKMTPEERLKSNDNAIRTIQELRNAFRQQRNKRSGLKCDT